MKRSLIAFTMVCMFLFSFVLNVHAAEDVISNPNNENVISQPIVEKPMTEKQWEARKRIIDENMIKLGADQEKLDAWLAANGIFKVQSEKQEPIETRSTGAQVDLTVDAYNDTIGHKYCIKGWWRYCIEKISYLKPQ